MNQAQLIAKNKVKSVVTDEVVTVESFWEKQPVVIIFLRRWGCMFCRLGALYYSSIKQDLDAHGVKLIGIGLEHLGKKDFIKGNFFSGELYIDEDKKCYNDLNFKRYGRLGIWTALLTKQSREAYRISQAQHIRYRFGGDYYQVGGILVVGAGGDKVLLSHKQQSLTDHVNVNEILKRLGIPPKRFRAITNESNCDEENKQNAIPCL